ncbi:hypothetical protein NM688_g4683 [Phlebia brevispora]|uniref:Uncharacterized protein n=1 Tax=Phlebia brevispora TaxID=194682 RepID=A0ACC1T1Y1_9APHY|nr:hypothetical protein NM688_g4683 [Phlebia brevispora]
MLAETMSNPKERTAESSSHHNEGPSDLARSTGTPSPTQSTIPNTTDDDVRSNAPSPAVCPIPVPDYADDDDVWSVGGRSPSSPMSPVPDRFEEDAEDNKENRNDRMVAESTEDEDDKENRDETMAGDTIKGQTNEEDESKYITPLSSVAARTYEDGRRQVSRSLVLRIPPKVHGVDASDGDTNGDQIVRPTWMDKGKSVDHRSYNLGAPSYKLPQIAECDEREETPELTREQSVASTSSAYLADREQLERSCAPGCSQKASSSGIHIDTSNQDSSANRVAPATLSTFTAPSLSISTAAALSTSTTGNMEMYLDCVGTNPGLSYEDSMDLTSDALLPSNQRFECTSIQPTFAHWLASQPLPQSAPGNFTFTTSHVSEQLPRFVLGSSASISQRPTRGRSHTQGNVFNKGPQPTPVHSTFISPLASKKPPHSMSLNSTFAAPLASQQYKPAIAASIVPPAHSACAAPPASKKPPQYPPSNFTSAHLPFAVPPAFVIHHHIHHHISPQRILLTLSHPLLTNHLNTHSQNPQCSFSRMCPSNTSCVDLPVVIVPFTFPMHDCEMDKTDSYPPDDAMDVDPPVYVDDDAMDVDPPVGETNKASMSASMDALDLSCNQSLSRDANNIVGMEGRQYMHPEASTSCISYTLTKDLPTGAQPKVRPSSLDRLRHNLGNNTDKYALFQQHSDESTFYKALRYLRPKKPMASPSIISIVPCPMAPTASTTARGSLLCMRPKRQASRLARSIQISPYRLRTLKGRR